MAATAPTEKSQLLGLPPELRLLLLEFTFVDALLIYSATITENAAGNKALIIHEPPKYKERNDRIRQTLCNLKLISPQTISEVSEAFWKAVELKLVVNNNDWDNVDDTHSIVDVSGSITWSKVWNVIFNFELNDGYHYDADYELDHDDADCENRGNIYVALISKPDGLKKSRVEALPLIERKRQYGGDPEAYVLSEALASVDDSMKKGCMTGGLKGWSKAWVEEVVLSNLERWMQYDAATAFGDESIETKGGKASSMALTQTSSQA